MAGVHENPHPTKRRRLDGGVNRSPSPSATSSDELALNSDVERRRASWAREPAKIYTAPRRYRREQSTDPDESESPDELAEDFDTYWRRRSGRNSVSGARQSSLDKDEEDAEDGASRSEHVRNGIEESSRTQSPPPPLPKPVWLNYKEKYILRGHQRGVSAVKISPDGSMVASGGKVSNKWILLLWFFVF